MKPDELLHALGNIDEEMIAQAKNIRRHRITPARMLILAAALVLVFSLTLSALAATDNDTAYQILYRISPAVAQYLKPVRMSCSDQGIEMEVISASIQGSEAAVYIAIRDLNGDRIDESADLYDSYDIHVPYDQACNCEMVGYSEDRKEATFLIHISTLNGEEIDSQKVTFSVTEILSGKEKFEGKIDGFSLDMIDLNAEMEYISEKDSREDGGFYALKANETLISDLLPGIHLRACAYDGECLRVQTKYDRIKDTDNHGTVYLVTHEGETIYPDGSNDFWTDSNSHDFVQEDAFRIGWEALEGTELHAMLNSGTKITRGNWSVTFPLTAE